jgi:hypothetical protein
VVGDGDGDTGGSGNGDGGTNGDGDVTGCTEIYLYGLNVRVIGGAVRPAQPYVIPPPEIADLVPPPTGGAGNVPDEYECVATVVAVDGDYSETLECRSAFDNPGDCLCQGAGERPGTYEVTASLDGQSQTITAEVDSDVCHVIPVDVTFFGPR